MTEKRIKELVEDTVRAMMRSYCFATGRAGEGRDEIIKTLRIAIAEAKNEGVEEMRDVLCLCRKHELSPCAVCQVAERLKEKV